MKILQLTKAELEEYLVHLKSVFQEVRILDTNCLGYSMAGKDGKLGEHQTHCYKIWNRTHRCDNCISCKVMEEKSIAHKFELMEDQVFIVFAKYVEVEGESHVIEALSLVGDDMIKNGDIDMPFKDAVKHTNHELYIDALTQVYNRRYYEEQILGIDDLNAVAYVDIDYFKEINDNYGHAAGDIVLKEVATFLKTHVRDRDHVIRLGGDEFLILFSRMNSENMKAVLFSLKNGAAKLHIEGYPEIEIHLSIGGCASDKFTHDMVDIADAQMYKVKHNLTAVSVAFK